MKHGRPLTQWMVLLVTAGILVLAGTGCECPKKLEALQAENQMLNERIIVLEDQLARADATATTPAPQTAEPAQSIYTVAEGDTLWSIAKRQLGKGSRYREILDLNPRLTENTPLTIGMKLTLPSE